MAENGMKPPETAEKSLGEIVNDVSQKATLLVREEIELAKAEVTTKATRIGKGVAAFGGAGFVALLGLIFFFEFLAFGIADWTGLKVWVGFAIVTALLFVLAGIAAYVGSRLVKRGSPPMPEMAIEEAKLTRETLEEVRH
jgi:hypothetical protein